MGKIIKGGWLPVTHLLVVSVALNLGFIFRLSYNEKDSRWSNPGQDDVVFPVVAHLSAVCGCPYGPTRFNKNGIRILNLNHGDPTMYEKLWQEAGDKSSTSIPGWRSISYFSDPSNLCWFLEPELAREILRLHQIVANAVTDNRHIVVGSGSIHLFQAALYALSLPQPNHPVSVVSSLPCYSSYKQVVEYLKSGLYKWKGDDVSSINEDEPYIEVVTSPNNPDGFMRQPLLNHSGGLLVHDFAYYWPQYTPITSRADHDIMLFTLSKVTGHAGMRIGWAIVKDEDVAKRMVKFIGLSSIGISRDSQLRAAKLLGSVSDSTSDFEPSNNFFELSFRQISRRWEQLREVVKLSRGLFTLSEYPSAFCKYSHRRFATQPAFVWLKCENDVEDCEEFLKGQKISTRGGKHFGVSPKFARISMLDRDENFNLFLKRMSMMHQGIMVMVA